MKEVVNKMIKDSRDDVFSTVEILKLIIESEDSVLTLSAINNNLKEVITKYSKGE